MADQGYATEPFKPIGVKRPVKYGPEATHVLSADNHEKLVQHIYNLLASDAQARSIRNGHMRAVETDLLGIVEPEGTDCQRAQKRAEGKGMSVPDHIYPFAYMTLHKFASELLSVLMPIEAPYAVVTGPDAQTTANQVSKALRHQSIMFDHRANLAACVFDTVALDLAGGFITWDKIADVSKQVNAAGTQSVLPTETAGVRIEHIDPYNLSYDSSLPPNRVELDGEFVAQFLSITPFNFRRQASRGQCFVQEDLAKDIIKSAATVHGGEIASTYYTGVDTGAWYYYEPEISASRARVHALYGTHGNNRQSSFAGLFSTEDASWTTRAEKRIHQIRIRLRLDPFEYGLKKGPVPAYPRPFEIWEIRLSSPGIITYAQPVAGRADRLPAFVASMNYDRKFGRAFKFGEHAAQLGLLGSTILNMHKRGLRKGLEGGVTIYNSSVIPLDRLDDMSGGRLPANMTRFDDDIRRHVMQLADTPDTNGNINNAQALLGMLEGLFPTNSQPAMAGLDRATQYQAQAVLMTSMRSLIYYAITLDSIVFTPVRFHVQELTLAKAADMHYIDEAKKQVISLAAADLQASQMVLVQSEPLIGIDRLRATTELRDMINIMFQSGGQLPPLAALYMKHYMQMSGLAIDPDEYEDALQKQLERDAAIQAAETAAAGASEGPPATTTPPQPTPAVGPAVR